MKKESHTNRVSCPKLSDFLEGIQMPREAIEQILTFSISQSEYQMFRESFCRDREEFYRMVRKQEQFRELFLSLYARMALEAYPSYRERGIAEEIYWNTFSDLTVWCLDCAEKYSVYGIDEYQWFWRHLELQLFGLGRLQFEKTASEWDISIPGTEIAKGDILISVHIPAGRRLEEEACREAFAKAFSFWGREYFYVCHSWLLFPGLQDILPADSNILKFQKFFRIVKTDFDERQAEQRIFGREQEEPEKYPAKTGLQKAAAAYLAEGRRLGNGLGILKSEDIILL